MGWWEFIPVALQVGSSLLNYSSSSSQNSNQQAWNVYNAQLGYNTAINNLAAQSAIAQANAQMANALGQFQADISIANAEFNHALIYGTTLYNDQLLEDKLAQMWDSYELDIQMLDAERGRELGYLRAQQSGSGLDMDYGTPQAVVIGQQTQHKLDALVIKHNADIAAAEIQNARYKNMWEGDMAMKKVIWDGQLNAVTAMANAGMQSATILAESGISQLAGRQSAWYQLQAGMYGAEFQSNYNNTSNWNNLASGLFNATNTAVNTYTNIKTREKQQDMYSSLLGS